MGIISTLSNNGYVLYNKCLARNLGINEAIYIGELCAEYVYWKENKKLEDDMFYSTQANIEYNTALTPRQQQYLLKKLIDLNILTVVKKGLPSRNYFKINEEELLKYTEESEIKVTNTDSDDMRDGSTDSANKMLEQVQTPSANKMSALVGTKLSINNNIINNNKENKDNISKDILYSNYNNNYYNDVADKMYSPQELQDTYSKKPKKSKGANLYSKCVDEINKFTDLDSLRDILVEYLKFRLSVKDKPLYGIAQWRSMLKNLDSVVSECNKPYETIVEQSLVKGWLNFYPISQQKKNVFSEFDNTTCEKKEEDFIDGDF